MDVQLRLIEDDKLFPFQGATEFVFQVEAFGRAAEVWEVANVMMFLASDYAGYMVGEIVSVSSQRA